MKYLLLLAVVLVVLWLMRGGSARRAGASRDKAPGPGRSVAPQDMVECPVCHVHLPRADALPGPNGQLYCCAEHRVRDGG